MNKLKTGVIGLGKMGLVHASILSTMPNVEVVVLCDKSRLILRLAKKLFKNAVVINDVEELVDLHLDFVYVTTPIPSHFPIVENLYSKGVTRNIFVEKTLSSSWDKAKKLCNSAESFGGVNMVGYMKRFAVTFIKAKSLLEEGLLGEPFSFDAYAYSSDFFGIPKSSGKFDKRGGVLNDLGSHVIDIAVWFFGNFEVDSAALNSTENFGGEDSCRFQVKKAGLEGGFEVSWCKENFRMPDFGLTIKGDNGSLKVNDDAVELKLKDGKSLTWHRHDLDDHVDFLLGAPEYYREDQHFINAILTGNNAEPNFRTASRVDQIIDQVRKKVTKID